VWYQDASYPPQPYLYIDWHENALQRTVAYDTMSCKLSNSSQYINNIEINFCGWTVFILIVNVLQNCQLNIFLWVTVTEFDYNVKCYLVELTIRNDLRISCYTLTTARWQCLQRPYSQQGMFTVQYKYTNIHSTIQYIYISTIQVREQYKTQQAAENTEENT
jgi:hypothetical protein